MKKYFKQEYKDGKICYVVYDLGVLGIYPTSITWHSTLTEYYITKIEECTREECIAAYEQTMNFLNDKINGN